MPPELSEEQRRALTAQPDGPVEIVDSLTQQTYVLVSAEAYARLAAEDAGAVREMEPLLAQLDPDDWEDPAVYDDPRP